MAPSRADPPILWSAQAGPRLRLVIEAREPVQLAIQVRRGRGNSQRWNGISYHYTNKAVKLDLARAQRKYGGLTIREAEQVAASVPDIKQLRREFMLRSSKVKS